MPRNVWTGKVSDDYAYDYTVLDGMPAGWRLAFGGQMMEELREALIASGKTALTDYIVLQVKEKFGRLCWYTNFDTELTDEVVSKYESLSQRTCIVCGKPATQITTSWISPFCDDCVPDAHNTISINEWFRTPERDDTPEEAAVKAAAEENGVRLDVIK